MNLISKFQTISNLRSLDKEGVLNRQLHAASEKRSISSLMEISQLLKSEMQNSTLGNESNLHRYLKTAEFAINMSFYSQDYPEALSLIRQVQQHLNGRNSKGEGSGNFNSWFTYLEFYENILLRITYRNSVEVFENQIDEFNWTSFDAGFIHKISALIGFTYLQEREASKYRKAKFWLEKAILESPVNVQFTLNYHLIQFFLKLNTTETLIQVQKKLKDFQLLIQNHSSGSEKEELTIVHQCAELSYLLSSFHLNKDGFLSLSDILACIEKIAMQIQKLGEEDYMFRTALSNHLASVLKSLSDNETDTDKKKFYLKEALRYSEQSVKTASLVQNDFILAENNILKGTLLSSVGNIKEGLRILKEAAAMLKKEGYWNNYVIASIAVSQAYMADNKPQKAYENALEILNTGIRKIEDSGFDHTNDVFEYITGLLIGEMHKPGISWMVAELYNFALLCGEVIDAMETRRAFIGKELFDRFKEAFIRLEPASHFNLKVYLLYQLMEIRLLEVSAAYNDDSTSKVIAHQLLSGLASPSNPLHFIYADWKEFKDVPNDVRNKVLNKCISITKGDLPLAAEHLDFSYRNLRSYITYNEVNRLGFFLDEQQTNSKKLEAGIRYMLHDLYLEGCIFEVVFDMPKFLVSYSVNGFHAEDMEKELNIKPTTAKKYLRIMLNIGLVEQDKAAGKKNFFLLNKEKVMNRYAQKKDLAVSQANG